MAPISLLPLLGVIMRTSAKLVAIATVSLLSACSDEPATPQVNSSIAVTTHHLTLQDTHISEQFIGKTQAVDEVDILPKVSGYIYKQHVKDGALVAKGDLLFEIDPEPFQIEVQKAKAVVAQKQAQLALHKKKLEKANKLRQQQALSAIELDQIIAAHQVASAEALAAQASLKKTRLDLKDTRIVAPFDGYISDSNVSPGALVGPNSQALTHLVSYRKMYVNIQLDEKEYLNDLQKKLQAGAAINPPNIKLQLANGTPYKHRGSIDFIDNQVDTDNGTVRFRINFPNPDGLLLPGQFVTVTSAQSVPTPKLVLPQSAVQEDQGGRYVFVVNSDQAVDKKYLTLGQRLKQDWIVEAGLTSGSQVIIGGISSIRPGMQVTVKNDAQLTMVKE